MSQMFPALLSYTALTFAGISGFVSLLAVSKQLRAGKPRDRFYEDADGRATPESLATFSNKGLKAVLLLLSILGTSTSAGSLFLFSLHNDNGTATASRSLQTTHWVLLLIQATCISIHHSPTESQSLSAWLAASACLLSISAAPSLTHTLPHIGDLGDVATLLWISTVIIAILLTITATLLPRRPNVFSNNRKVDSQWSVSVLSRYTWSWAQPLLRHASLHHDIAAEDVPHPDSNLRSQDLSNGWDSLISSGSSLFRSLMKMYKTRFALLWAVTLVRGFVSILPFWFMFQILRILQEEQVQSRDEKQLTLLTLILCLALSNLVDSWMEGWLYWYSHSSIALPVRTQISGIVFNKALGRKIVRTVTQKHDSRRKDSIEASIDDATLPMSHQSIVNLVGVDTERLSAFLQYHFMIINGIVKLAITSVFLFQLLGLVPFAAGILAWAVTLPMNTWLSTRVLTYSRMLMKVRDAKLARINEMLSGLRQIKFSAVESEWAVRILAMRETELRALWRFFLADSGLFACWVISPILLAVASLSAYVLMNGSLLPSIAFVSIGLFQALEITLGSLPELFTLALDSIVSINRIDAYLQEPETLSALSQGHAITFEGASVSWPTDHSSPQEERFVIRDLNLTFPHGALSVISGRVGSGKTLLLSALLGEADLLSGTIRVPMVQSFSQGTVRLDKWIIPGSTAYISQTPWLENTSLKNNVLFGLPFVKERYDKVMESCALSQDLSALPDGDDTELGANGVNLSGGQKWRVTLARAVYSRAEILLMEDVFSAVDSHVGAWIFEKCLSGDICMGRTRILVTHHLGLVVAATSFLVELVEGKLIYAGPPKSTPDTSGRAVPEDLAQYQDSRHPVDLVDAAEPETKRQTRPTPGAPEKFMQEETRQKGSIKGEVYLTYLQSSGGLLLWAGCLAVYLAFQAGTIGRAWWMRKWTGTDNARFDSLQQLQVQSAFVSVFPGQSHFHGPFMSTTSSHDTVFYLNIYVAISVVTAIIGILRNVASYSLAIRASRDIFRKVLFAVLHVPLRWLDTVPAGRILNRFTADFNIIDERLIMTWSLFFSNLLRLVGICFASCLVSAHLVVPAALLFGLGMMIGKRYLAASRPLKRLESNAKSPVFELFNTTLTGLSTIRAFQRTQTYLMQMHRDLDAWVMTTFYIALANRWMSFRMAIIAMLFSVVVGVAIIITPIDAALAGLALSFVLDFTESLRWSIRCYGDMELEMNAMERVAEYMALETEPSGGESPAASWPASGTIELTDLAVAYTPKSPLVLKGISLTIEDGERVGIVGRTGAGKSTLTLALFRFLEARSGTVVIDGVDIAKIPLPDLRSRLSIIPQHPVLFSGTIRSNLDPSGNHTDVELYQSLAKVHLTDSPLAPANLPSTATTNTNIFHDLSSPVSESGSNLSQGQQQLICIVRVLLDQSKIVVFDEATSAVDIATDNLIQQNIREWFCDRTLIVVAHRLSTVSDFDKIVVLENGYIVECGTPQELWVREGTFRGMCDSSGRAEGERLRREIMSRDDRN